MPERATVMSRSEESAAVAVADGRADEAEAGAEGLKVRTGSALSIETGSSQMFANAKLADTVDRVKPDRPRQRETSVAESTSRNLRHSVEATQTW